ncbi:MAG TPA: GAF domain-containing protein [Candidatus Methanoperedens sp.]|nr:GAF domain-containing protein [Candidatus Methanoperedens sp.]
MLSGDVRKSRFAALLLGFSAACALLFLTFYGDAKDAAVARLQEQQRMHLRQAARGVEDYFATWTGILAAFSRMDEIVDLDANGRRFMKLFLEAHGEQIRSITRMDERGVILASHPFSDSEGRDLSGQRHVREILRDHRPVVSDVFRAVQGFDGIALHVPVFKGTAFKGSIAVVVNFESLAKRYFDVIRIGETGYAWVVSRDATLLYTPVPGLTGKSAVESFEAFPSVTAMIADMLQGREGVATYLYDRIAGQTVAPVRKYAVYMPIRLGNTFWSVVVASTEQELLAGLISFRNRLALFVGLVYVGGMLLAIVAVKAWTIVREEEGRRRAEQTLRVSEQKFMKAFHATPDAIVISRVADGLLLEVNEVFLSQTGYSREEAQGQTTVGLALWADPGDRERYVSAVRAEGRVREMEARFLTKSGAVLDGLVSGEGIEIEGEPCLLTIIRDVTERKRVDDQLRSLNEELSATNRIISSCTGVLDPQAILEKVLDEAIGLAGVEGGTICLVTPAETLLLAAHRETSAATIRDLTENVIKVGECLCGACARDRRPLILRNREEVLKYATREATRGEEIRFHAAFPLVSKERCLGVLCVFTRTDRKPRESRLHQLETATAQIALALENAQLHAATVRHAAELEEKVKARTADLEVRIAEIERMNKLFVNREFRIKELKDQVAGLERERQGTTRAKGGEGTVG